MIAIPGRYDYKPYAYGFQKDSPYLQIFNHYIKAMHEKGSLKQIIEKYTPPPQICPDLTGEALGFNSCISAFLVLIGGASFGLILLAIELCARKTGWKCACLAWYGTTGNNSVVLNIHEDPEIQMEAEERSANPELHQTTSTISAKVWTQNEHKFGKMKVLTEV